MQVKPKKHNEEKTISLTKGTRKPGMGVCMPLFPAAGDARRACLKKRERKKKEIKVDYLSPCKQSNENGS